MAEALTAANQGVQSLTSDTISVKHLLSIVNEMYSDILPAGVAKHFGNTRKSSKLGKSVRWSQLDENYLTAVREGDMKTAQAMVDEAASAAGYARHLHHGARRAACSRHGMNRMLRGLMLQWQARRNCTPVRNLRTGRYSRKSWQTRYTA